MEFTQHMERSFMLLAGLVWPVFVAVAALASQWVPLLLGEEWNLAVPIVQVLCIVAIIQSLVTIPALAVVGLGHTHTKFRIDVLLTSATFAAILLGSQGGILGVLVALIVGNLSVLPLQLPLAVRHLPVPLDWMLPVIVKSATANLVLAVFLVSLAFAGEDRLGSYSLLGLGAALASLVPFILFAPGLLRKR